MIRSAKALAGAAALAFVVGGTMAAAATTGADGAGLGKGAADDQCVVNVDRSAAANSYDVTRTVNQGGQCVCYVRTGPESQGGNAEALLAALLRSRDCSTAPAAVGGAGGLGSFFSTTGGIVTGVVAGGAIIAGGVALANGNDSP